MVCCAVIFRRLGPGDGGHCQRQLHSATGRIRPNLVRTSTYFAERLPGHTVLADHRGHRHLASQVLVDRGELVLGETPRSAQILSPPPSRVQPCPGPPADVVALLAGHVGSHAGQDVSHEGLWGVLIGVEEPGPLGFVAGQRPEPDSAALQYIDCPYRLDIALAEPVDSDHHQDVPLGELLVQDVPLAAGAVRRRALVRNVAIDKPGLNVGVDELAALDLGGAACVASLLVPAGADVAEGGHVPILPVSARVSQEATVSIFATGGIRAVFSHAGRVDLTLGLRYGLGDHRAGTNDPCWQKWKMLATPWPDGSCFRRTRHPGPGRFQ